MLPDSQKLIKNKAKKEYQMQKTTEKFLLHASEIDRFSQLTVHLLQQMKINPRDILRFRLSMENVMEIWMHELGENTTCTFTRRL